jgi:hypothetical protein
MHQEPAVMRCCPFCAAGQERSEPHPSAWRELTARTAALTFAA